MDDEEFIDDFLQHYGVLGMKWGARKDALPGVPRATNREARKDAREFTRAKMYYGEGAGTRRKLIKATVEAKSKRDASYKRAFDHHVSRADMAKRASQARGERARTDVKNHAVKTAKGVRHIINGNNQWANATAALLVGGALFAHKKGIDKVIFNAAKTNLRAAQIYIRQRV